MLRLHGILGHEKDARFHDRLHELEHRDGIECLFVAARRSRAAKRFRLATDRGTDCAVSLDRDEDLADGALLFLDDQRAIIARFGEQAVWRLRPAKQSRRAETWMERRKSPLARSFRGGLPRHPRSTAQSPTIALASRTFWRKGDVEDLSDV